MWLFVGLGNPGAKYFRTPHNLGFDAIDLIASRQKVPWCHVPRFKGLVAEGTHGGEKLFLLKPMTYMNLSGDSVVPFMQFYKIGIERLLVTCDDVNIPLGKLRLRERGGPGGHNGLRDLIEKLATEDFARLRIGCQPPHPPRDMAAFVLSPLWGDGLQVAQLATHAAADCMEAVLTDGPLKTMSIYNSWAPPSA